MDIQEITRAVEQESVVVRQIMANMEKVIVGQRYLIERMIIGLLCDGHLLLEGLPGLAKTTSENFGHHCSNHLSTHPVHP